jgi:hypothetical protein
MKMWPPFSICSPAREIIGWDSIEDDEISRSDPNHALLRTFRITQGGYVRGRGSSTGRCCRVRGDHLVDELPGPLRAARPRNRTQ